MNKRSTELRQPEPKLNNEPQLNSSTSSPAIGNTLVSRSLSVKPILFSTEMVRAIIEGRKTQTRRVIKLQPEDDCYYELKLNEAVFTIDYNQGNKNPKIKCPYGNVGDVLWVRETYGYDIETGKIIYEAGTKYSSRDKEWENESLFMDKRLPSILMPKKVCRIFLKLTDIRVEQLQDIDSGDCIAEGYDIMMSRDIGSIPWFKRLWIKINGQESWESNPFVWVIEFERCERPLGFC